MQPLFKKYEHRPDSEYLLAIWFLLKTQLREQVFNVHKLGNPLWLGHDNAHGFTLDEHNRTLVIFEPVHPHYYCIRQMEPLD